MVPGEVGSTDFGDVPSRPSPPKGGRTSFPVGGSLLPNVGRTTNSTPDGTPPAQVLPLVPYRICVSGGTSESEVRSDSESVPGVRRLREHD